MLKGQTLTCGMSQTSGKCLAVWKIRLVTWGRDCPCCPCCCTWDLTALAACFKVGQTHSSSSRRSSLQHCWSSCGLCSGPCWLSKSNSSSRAQLEPPPCWKLQTLSEFRVSIPSFFSDNQILETPLFESGLSFSVVCPSDQQSFMSELDSQVPTAFDPFADANAEDSGAGTKEYVHIRVQQRNGRKSLTTVQGLKKEYSYSKILKDLKKEFCCNGTVVQDSELGQVIQLQGDQRKNVSTFLVQAGLVKKDNIKIHGF
ncbi:hypothetical protein EUTSA_v10026037mg [Eutrema salsugineum]|uniref:SUI1 domain-containing protein n=2 Tax=Brassicaceae TaxID=3700 RepID=V4MH10_EUTSA|nr:hypothetical protein EUTSA_v10026037mg [Eutrema salsugineum]